MPYANRNVHPLLSMVVTVPYLVVAGIRILFISVKYLTLREFRILLPTW